MATRRGGSFSAGAAAPPAPDEAKGQARPQTSWDTSLCTQRTRGAQPSSVLGRLGWTIALCRFTWAHQATGSSGASFCTRQGRRTTSKPSVGLGRPCQEQGAGRTSTRSSLTGARRAGTSRSLVARRSCRRCRKPTCSPWSPSGSTRTGTRGVNCSGLL